MWVLGSGVQIPWLTPVFQRETGNVDKVPRVVRDEGETKGQRMGSDHLVPVLILLVLVGLFERGQDAPVLGGGVQTEGKDGDAGQKPQHGFPVPCRVAAVLDAVFQLRVGDHGDAHIPANVLCQLLRAGRPGMADREDDDVRIQHVHVRTQSFR